MAVRVESAMVGARSVVGRRGNDRWHGAGRGAGFGPDPVFEAIVSAKLFNQGDLQGCHHHSPA